MTFVGYDTAGSATPTAIATSLISLYGTHIDPVMNSLVTLSACRVKKGPMEDGPFAEVSTSNSGASVSPPCPPNVAYLIRKITPLGGKMGQGRMYQPGVPEAGVGEDGTIVSGTRSSTEAGWSAFLAAMDGAGFPMALGHMFGDYVNRKGVTIIVPARAPTDVTALTVDAKAATQRRRLRG